MVTTKDKPGVFARCSFCLRPNTDVFKLVAGPGVFICDTCVQLAADVIAGEGEPPERKADTPVASWDQEVPLDVLLETLAPVAAAQAQADQNLHLWVTRARSQGATWTQLGQALGMARQSAWERFSGEE